MARLKNETKRTVTESGGKKTEEYTVSNYNIKTIHEKFYNTFADGLNKVFEIKSVQQRHVLDILCMWAEYNTGTVYMPKHRRIELGEILKIPYHSVNNAISGLLKLKLIVGVNGMYIINPNIFWKGELKQRNELLNNKDIMERFVIDKKVNNELKPNDNFDKEKQYENENV